MKLNDSFIHHWNPCKDAFTIPLERSVNASLKQQTKGWHGFFCCTESVSTYVSKRSFVVQVFAGITVKGFVGSLAYRSF